VLHHGTYGREFGVLDPSRKPRHKAEDVGLGIFLAPNPDFADLFTFTDAYWQGSGPIQRHKGARLLPLFAAIEQPKEYASFFDLWADARAAGGGAALRKRLEAEGHDGAHVLENRPGTKYQETWVAFRPVQVKSVTGNRGEFRADDPDPCA
jgi:hypothetical protein